MKHHDRQVIWKLGKSAIFRESLGMVAAFSHLAPRFAKDHSEGVVDKHSEPWSASSLGCVATKIGFLYISPEIT